MDELLLGQNMSVLRASRLRLRRLLRRMERALIYPVLGQLEISAALSRLQPRPKQVLMVHSSLSACGQIKGGSTTVIDVLREWINNQNLVLPTHTYCYPDSNGTVPVYDARSSFSVVGTITNDFWQQAGVVRSIHPTHSLAASGPDAEAICAGHQLCETPCGKGTPYERLIQQDCATLMFGVTMDVYTFFHTAEDAAELPFLYEERPYVLKYKDSQERVRTFTMRRQNMQITRRFERTADWLEARGLLVRQKLGLGELLYLPHAGAVHRAVVEHLRRDPFFLVDESARPPLSKRYAIKI